MRKLVQEKLIKFATRIPAFMYLTDFRENTLQDVITKLEQCLRGARHRRGCCAGLGKGHPECGWPDKGCRNRADSNDHQNGSGLERHWYCSAFTPSDSAQVMSAKARHRPAALVLLLGYPEQPAPFAPRPHRPRRAGCASAALPSGK